MPTSSVFGDILPAHILERGAEAALQTWFPDYLREIEAQYDLTPLALEPPKRYTKRNSLDATPGEELPRCIVIAPGITGTPRKNGKGTYSASWRLGIGLAIAGDTDEEANDLIKFLGAAARKIILDKGGSYGLGDVAWVDESYDDIPITNQTQQYRAASIWFVCSVNNVVTKKIGPEVPDSAPYVYHTAEQVIVDLEKSNG